MPDALKALQQAGHSIVAFSDVLINPACGPGFEGLFHNQLLILASKLPESDLKQQFEQLEMALGREAKTPLRKYNNRTIDIDILSLQASAEQCLKVELKDSYNQTIMARWQPVIQ